MKRAILLIFILSLFSLSCSKEESDQSRIKLKVSAVNDEGLSSRSIMVKSGNNENVVLTDFRISIRDVVFKNDEDSSSYLDTDEIRFRGPYQIDLLNDASALSQTIGNVVVPDGLYKELRFKFHKDEDLPITNELYDKSIYIEGNINEQPFIFWHDTSENLDVGRSTGVSVNGGMVDLTVQFDISQFLSSLIQIDLTEATDDNNNGIIEIYPNDQDGNQDMAKDLKDNIKETADLINY